MRRCSLLKVYRIPCSLLVLLAAGCTTTELYTPRPTARRTLLAPLPTLKQKSQRDTLLFLLQEAGRRVDSSAEPAMLWRRIAAAYRHLGAPDQELDALLKAGLATEDLITRSLIADRFEAAGRLDLAKSVLDNNGYVGAQPRLAALARPATPTKSEGARLDGVVVIPRGNNNLIQVFPTRLVMQLVVRGAQDEARRRLKRRLDFALERGPLGGRTLAFHDAILCSFYLGNRQAALAATERETPYARLQTLFCLLLGGATDAESCLYVDNRPGERDIEPSLAARNNPVLRREITNRIADTLRVVPTERSADATMPIEHLNGPALGRMAILCALLKEWELATIAGQRLRPGAYHDAVLAALARKEVPLLAGIRETEGLSPAGVLNQNLARIVRLSHPPLAQRLLTQAVQQSIDTGLSVAINDYLSQVAWSYERPDLILRLLEHTTTPWFRCAQQLRLARYYRERGKATEAKAALRGAQDALAAVTKKNQRILIGLDYAEEAHQQATTDGLEAIFTNALQEIPGIATSTIRMEALTRFARVSALGNQEQHYAWSREQARGVIQEIDDLFPAEADRLRIELALRLIGTPKAQDALALLQDVKAVPLQAQALCRFVELTLKLPPLPRSYPSPDLFREADSTSGAVPGAPVKGSAPPRPSPAPPRA